MGERGRMSQVSVNDVSCVRLELLPPEGALSFPFCRSREGPGVHEREKKRKRNRRKKKTERKRALGLRHLSSSAGPAIGIY
jgi:hypothetical protein